MKRLLALAMTLCLLVCTGSVAVEGADKVYALTMGVRRYSADNAVIDGGVATVTYTRHKDGSTGSAGRIYDISSGETFTLTTAVREEQKNFYAFVGWLDENGALIGTQTTLEVTMDSSKAAFAVYAENADRHVLTYTVVGEGKVSVSSDHPVETGVGCASILHGASALVAFAPAKGYSAYYVKVDGQKVSFLHNACGTLSDAVKSGRIRDAFNALVNIVRFFLGGEAVYTIPVVQADMTFEVGFIKPFFEKK